VSQDVCAYNHKFASEHSEPAFAPRAALSGGDARALATEPIAAAGDAPAVERMVLDGAAAPAIAAHAERCAAELVTLTSHGRGGLSAGPGSGASRTISSAASACASWSSGR